MAPRTWRVRIAARTGLIHRRQTSSSSASLCFTRSSIWCDVPVGGGLRAPSRRGRPRPRRPRRRCAMRCSSSIALRRMLRIVTWRPRPCLGHLDHLAAALLGQLRDDHPDDLPVVGRVDARGRSRGSPSRWRLSWTGVVGLDDAIRASGHVDRGELVDRGHRAVVVDDDAREHVRGGAAGADAGQVVLGHRDGLLHLLLGVEERLVDHGCSSMSFCSIALSVACP